LNHGRREERETSATVLETDEATVQFEIPILGASLIQVLDSFGQVPLPLYYKFPGGWSQYQTVYGD